MAAILPSPADKSTPYSYFLGARWLHADGPVEIPNSRATSHPAARHASRVLSLRGRAAWFLDYCREGRNAAGNNESMGAAAVPHGSRVRPIPDRLRWFLIDCREGNTASVLGSCRDRRSAARRKSMDEAQPGNNSSRIIILTGSLLGTVHESRPNYL